MQASATHLWNSLPLHRPKIDMEYPQILFNDSMGIGQSQIIDPSKLSFWASDFPIVRKSDLWDGFPTCLHFQPKKILPLPQLPAPFSYPNIVSSSQSPSFEEWERNLDAFKKTPLEKVVLARKSSFVFEKPISPLGLFHFLREKSPNAFVFALILSPKLAFLGATPEKLFIRNGPLFETEALAGTRICKDEAELLSSHKETKEILIVKEILTDQLQKICKPFSISQKFLLKRAGNVSHLHMNFSAELKKNFSDLELIKLLHPTPAIAGNPRELALAFINEFEPFDRGYYAGTQGIMSNSRSEIYVGIRSALIKSNEMHVFTGAGILPESNPLLEWQELDHKQGIYNL